MIATYFHERQNKAWTNDQLKEYSLRLNFKIIPIPVVDTATDYKEAVPDLLKQVCMAGVRTVEITNQIPNSA